MPTTLKTAQTKSFADSAQEEVGQRVRQIIGDIRTRGAAAVAEYSQTFDRWSPTDFRLDAEQIAAIMATLPQQVIDDIVFVQTQVRRFAQAQRDSLTDVEIETLPGVRLGHRHVPVGSAGAYIPGGKYPLTASAHMTIITAKVAGVPRVVACTPPIKGEIPAATVAAMHLAGADEIWILGGVQAVASMALGTESPTEILVIADDEADPFVVAVDLLSQAEHGPESPAILVTTSAVLGEQVMQHIEQILPAMPTRDYAEPAWRDFGQVIVVDDLDEAFAVADSFAAEHVQVLTENPRQALDKMRDFGALFLGENTCVSYGDKVIGTNHVLPTLGAARYTGGLWVGKYLKTVTYQEVTDEASSAELGRVCGRAARVELFEGHARSGDVRAWKLEGDRHDWIDAALAPSLAEANRS
jgi:sulfopropanediol 3-dehydrogenase